MRETSLNLIAITIFTLTLTALLGPMFNLSAAIPAGMVFVLLGLATLDTFTLQGQGSTILVDWLAGTSGQTRDRILHHEAGHFLVAHLLGIPVEGYALTAWEAFRQGQTAQGGVRFDDRELMAQLRAGMLSGEAIDKYCKVWMAGIAAETLLYDHAEGGMEDRQKIAALWAQLGRSPREAQMKQRWATLQAKTLIETHRPAYDALVEAMAQRTPATECLQLIADRIRS
ncbi:MAG: ATP-dependent Zn protease [Limnospira sp.]